ncbi:MAG TPA: fatty acid hydroxylase [Cytophagales bacterium]|nr:fatty acid hydroxylase [Cytophagales bacterium]HAA21968.1 fatty acid hydroxylase [Cytophagales bacterium]HAP61335.1 fatty acid hydroxylase [Cytophagales bacterium]
MQILILLSGIVFMEVFSWAFHKYIMHGVLWSIHKTHHVHTKGYFEWNDVFTLIFGGSATVLIILGAASGFDGRFWFGAGIATYGLAYFVLHDVLIHRRIKWLKRSKNRYLKGITKAHADHHKSRFKDGSVCFGLLMVPKKYFKNDNA